MAETLCPYFGSCGGCSAQHIDYALQLENKKKQLEQMTKVHVEVFSDREYFYRNRMDFIFHAKGLGLRRKGKWDTFVPIEKCVIAEEKINILLKEIQDYFQGCDYFDVKKHSGTFRYAVLRCTEKDSSVSFVLNSTSTRLQESIEKIKHFSSLSLAKNILITYTPPQSDISTSSDYFIVKGKDFLETHFLGKTFFYPIQGFFQNNHAMAEKMQDYVCTLLNKYPTSKGMLLDLYGGVGTFGIMNAASFKKVLIVESVKESIEYTTKNIDKNEITNAQAFCLDAKHISRLSFMKPLFVISDPPRSGMDPKTISILNQEKPECILYISCNPEQLAKDLFKFRDYEIKSAALFDLFPQTPHSEVIVELVKKSS